MSASEIKYVYSEWESKGQAVLLPYALQYNYEEIDGLLKDMDNIANEAGIGGIGYQSQESGITKLAEWAGYLNAYISSVIPELQESLDKPLYIAFNHHAAEDLSRIRMEDYTTENKLGIKRWVTVPGTEGVPARELVEDTTLSMEDFLGLTVLEEAGERKIIGMPKEFQDFTDMFAVDYNLIKDELEKQNGKEVTLEDYLLSIKSAGEFSHKMDKPVEEFISAVLDITAVKPLIECCTGYDMITGEDLSDFERGMKGVSAVVSLFTLGQGSIVMNGGKLALGETLKMGAKILAVDAISTGVSYGTSEICQAMGCPGGLTLVLSLLAGMGTSAGLGSKVFGNGGLTPDDVIALNRVDYDEIIKLRKGNEGAGGPKFSETFDNWDDMKNAHKGTVTQFVKDNKPLGSTHPRDWLKNGGSLTIDTLDDGTQIWKYTKDGITVPYVPKMVNGKMQNIIQFPGEYLYKIDDVFDGSFKVPEGFTGNRTTDMKNAIKHLDNTYGIDEIPKGYILHHDIDNGVFQLVRNNVHSGFSHYGGYYYNK